MSSEQEFIQRLKQQSNPTNSSSDSSSMDVEQRLIQQAKSNTEQQEDTDDIFDKTADLFSGTKRTEFAAMPEIGSYTGEGSFTTAVALSLTPDQKSQAEIIQKAIPGAAVREDKYGNAIINVPDGRNFYLNKPGASFQDALQTTSQILQYIPGYNMVAKKAAKSYLKRVLGQSAVSGATSVGQDLGAKALGAEDYINLPKTGMALAVPVAFEGAVVPLGRGIMSVLKRMGKNKKYVNKKEDGTISLTDEGKKVLEESGADPNTVNDEFIDKFFKNFNKGLKNDISKVKEEAEFGIDMAASQTGLAKDKISLANLYEAAKGAFGTTAQRQSIEFLEKQNVQIKDGFKSIMNRFNKGQIDIEDLDLDKVGINIRELIRKKYDDAIDATNTAYNQVDKRALYTGGGSNIQLLANSTRKGVIDSVGVIEPRIMPGTVAALKSIDDLVAQVRKSSGGKEVDDVVFDTFEKRRVYLNDLINQAKKEGGPDYRALVSVKKSYDKFLSDNADNALFAGGDKALKAMLKARKSVVERERLLGINPIIKNGVVIKDKAGEVLHKIINDPDITPFEVMNYAIGAKKLGAGQIPLKVIKRLKKIMGVTDIEKSLTNSDFVSLRTAALERVMSNSIKNDKFLPATLVREFDEVFKNNKDFMKELFTAKEIKQLRGFVETVRKTTAPTDIMNMSNTASLMQRMVQQASRGFLGAIALKMGGINALLATRNAFDRAGELVIQRKGRDKVLSQIGDETTSILGKVRKGITKKPDPLIKKRINTPGGDRLLDVRVEQTPSILGAAQQSMGLLKGTEDKMGRRPPQIQPSEMNQGATPVLDRNMFGSLFPGDTLGAAISERKK